MAILNWSVDGANWPNRSASRFIEAAGIRWHVQRMGAGPSLLLLHGTGAATHSWRGLLPLLADHFDVIAPDLPGHGFTSVPAPYRLSLPGMAADIAALLRRLDASPSIVVGHSAGAAILARMCLDGRITPDLLVSLNGAFLPFGGFAGHLFAPLAKFLVMNPMVPRLFAWQAASDGGVERLLDNTGSHIDAEGIAQYRRLVRSSAHVAAALRMMANWQLEPLQRDLPRLKAKLVLVAASGDRTISSDVARRVANLVPGAVIARVASLGHLAHEEQPALIAQMILKHAALEANMSIK
ncbi:alpha/beta fold hydrolase BchO [Tardiphaga sp.]|uniref:alpha/beta fold hydrolase BchO n=1 Tax=Tardiphaga sp. TaxID=1926292 RepID=UPI0025EE482B|nr:alpha/beta fold hydrolase BchO [Tardiphaga sp.]